MKNRAKVVLLGLVVGLGIVIAGGRLYAHEGHRKMNAEKHLKKMTKKLSLTAEQQDQVKKLLEEKKQKMEEIGKSFHEQLRNLLTDDQKKKWDADEAKEEKEHKDKK